MATREQLIEDFADHKYATGEKFARLINSMKVVQEPVETPAASGTSLSFIDSIEQDKDGKITATKKTLDLSNAHELNPFKGWWKTGDTLPTSGFDGAYLYFKDTTQTPAVTTIYRWNGTTYADTGTVVDESNVNTFGSGQALNTVKIKDDNGEEVAGDADVLSAEAGERISERLQVIKNNVDRYDLKIADKDGNVIVELAGGHLRTKNFNSASLQDVMQAFIEAYLSDNMDIDVVNNEDSSYDMKIADENGKAIMRLAGGHVQTKNFNSADLQSVLSGLDSRISDVEGVGKKHIKILFIGNSVTLDHVVFLPLLLKELYGDSIDFKIGNYYIGGHTIKQYAETDIGYDDSTVVSGAWYRHAENTKVWTNEGNKSLPYAVHDDDWDFICIQSYAPSPNEDVSYAPTLVAWLREENSVSFELGYLMHQWFKTTGADALGKKKTIEAAQTVVGNNPVTLFFAPYFCMEEAQQTGYWPEYSGVLTPGYIDETHTDNTHLREGLAPLITGMHLMQVICSKLGLNAKILNNGIVITQEVYRSINFNGDNGVPDYTLLASDDTNKKAQYCAIQGGKDAEAFYESIIDSRMTSFVESIINPNE